MQLLGYQDIPDTGFGRGAPDWTEIIGPVVALIVLIPLLIWLFRFLGRAMSQGKQCLDHTTTAIEVTREGIRVSQEAIEMQRETNRLLAELNEALRNRPPS